MKLANTCTDCGGFPRLWALVATFTAAASLTGGFYAVASARSAAPGPVMGRTVAVSRVSGTVLVKGPHSRRFSALTGRRLIAIGSTVDATHGRVRLTSAANRHGKTQTGDFYEGAFVVSQSRSRAFTSLRLVGSDFSTCAHSASDVSPVARIARRHPRRHLWGSGRGSFGTSGGHAGAVVRGTVWLTEDDCEGTFISAAKDTVVTTARGAPLSTSISPGQSVEYNCGHARPVSSAYCLSLLGTPVTLTVNGRQVRTPSYVATLLTRSTDDQYDLCTTGPSLTACNPYPLGRADRSGYRRSDVYCVPDQGPGDYQSSWRVRGTFIGDTLTYHAPSAVPAGVKEGCTSTPLNRPGVPADLIDTQASAHFVVHYNNNPSDPNSLTDQDATNVLNNAEAALAFETGTLGMPPYVNDGDNKIDIYAAASNKVLSTVHDAPPAGQQQLPQPGFPSSAYIVQSANFDLDAMAWSVYDVLIRAIGRIPGDMLVSSGGRWAGANFVQGASSEARDFSPTLSQPVDCDSSCPSQAVFRQWRFLQHLSELYGPTVVRDAITADARLLRAGPGSHVAEALQQVLAAHGSSLSNELGQYALEVLLNNWRDRWMKTLGTQNPFDGGSFDTQALSPAGQSFTRQVQVPHLASHIVSLTVAADTTDPCVTNTLTETITFAPGGSVPGGGIDNRSTGSISRPSATSAQLQDTFDSCTGTFVNAVLTNGTTNATSMTFQISGSLVRGP